MREELAIPPLQQPSAPKWSNFGIHLPFHFNLPTRGPSRIQNNLGAQPQCEQHKAARGKLRRRQSGLAAHLAR